MPAWSPITLDTVAAYAQDARLHAALRNAGQVDVRDATFAILAPSVIARIRAKIATCADNTLDTDTAKIPPEWVEYACLVILRGMLARMGAQGGMQTENGTFVLTADQTAAIEQYETDLEAVARGELAVTASDDPATEDDHEPDGSPPLPSVGCPRTTFSRANQDGL